MIINPYLKKWKESGRPRDVKSISSILSSLGFSGEQLSYIFKTAKIPYQAPEVESDDVSTSSDQNDQDKFDKELRDSSQQQLTPANEDDYISSVNDDLYDNTPGDYISSVNDDLYDNTPDDKSGSVSSVEPEDDLDPEENNQEPIDELKDIKIPVGFSIKSNTGREFVWKGAQWITQGKILPKKYRDQVDKAAKSKLLKLQKQQEEEQAKKQKEIDAEYEFDSDDEDAILNKWQELLDKHFDEPEQDELANNKDSEKEDADVDQGSQSIEEPNTEKEEINSFDEELGASNLDVPDTKDDLSSIFDSDRKDNEDEETVKHDIDDDEYDENNIDDGEYDEDNTDDEEDDEYGKLPHESNDQQSINDIVVEPYSPGKIFDPNLNDEEPHTPVKPSATNQTNTKSHMRDSKKSGVIQKIATSLESNPEKQKIGELLQKNNNVSDLAAAVIITKRENSILDILADFKKP